MDKLKHSLDFEKPIHELQVQLENLHRMSEESNLDVAAEIEAIKVKIEDTRRQIHAGLTPWQKVQLARHPQRPYSLDYIGAVFDDFQELHGDRNFRDDRAIIGGPAFFDGRPVMVVGQQKGRSTKENLARNFGCANPEGYRKAMRLMEMGEKFRLPIITLIDTPGAYPGIGAEERHVAEAIAHNIREMSGLKTPIIAVVIGEGGSGGALGIAVADRVLILDNAYYSVISPEGCAAILWKDRPRATRCPGIENHRRQAARTRGGRRHRLGTAWRRAHRSCRRCRLFAGRTEKAPQRVARTIGSRTPRRALQQIPPNGSIC